MRKELFRSIFKASRLYQIFISLQSPIVHFSDISQCQHCRQTASCCQSSQTLTYCSVTGISSRFNSKCNGGVWLIHVFYVGQIHQDINLNSPIILCFKKNLSTGFEIKCCRAALVTHISNIKAYTKVRCQKSPCFILFTN